MLWPANRSQGWRSEGGSLTTLIPLHWKTSAKLIIRRQIKKRLPVTMKPTMDKVDKEAMAMDKWAREKRKIRFDKYKNLKEQDLFKGDSAGKAAEVKH